MKCNRIIGLVGFVFFIFTSVAMSAEDPYRIAIKDHKFEPQELSIPANQKIKIVVDNQDATPEEFESYDLNREKVIGGNKKATIFVGPLKPGRYKYFGEFNPKTAQGVIVAEESVV